jgi:hypothetical protein
MVARINLCVSLVLSFASASQAAQYFVSNAGNDAWPGTAAQPWRTLQFAAGEVGPGDFVTVRTGATAAERSYAGFHLTVDGTASAPITFFAEPGVVINSPNPVRTQHGINLENASHVVIDGFEVTGMQRAGIRSVGVDGDTFASNVTIRNVHSHHNGYWGILTGFVNDLVIENNVTSHSTTEHGIYVSNSGDRPTIRNNLSFANRANGIHMNGDSSVGGDGIISNALVSGNIIHGNGVGGGSGINMDGVQNSRIENNLLYDNHASGISLYRIDGGAGSTGNVVVNNTIYQADNGRWAVNIRDGSTGNTVLNNILLHAGSRGAISVWADSQSGFISDYNIVTDRFTTTDGDSTLTLAQWQANTGDDLHSIAATAAQLFETPASDFHLLPSAVAIDFGTTTQAPNVDLEGQPRPYGAAIDAGVYEWHAAAISGDFNRDGEVDAGDYVAWAKINGLPGGYAEWRTNFGFAAGSRAGQVPEPATGTMLTLCLFAMGYTRRSRIAIKH